MGGRGLNGEYHVKVADFGLSRDIYTTEYYRTKDKARPMPMKWMAPESLQKDLFTSPSDVVGFTNKNVDIEWKFMTCLFQHEEK